jgi:hypothetical protein
MKITGFIFILGLTSFLSAKGQFNLFTENGKVGLKDQTGKILIPAHYESLGWSNGSFSVIDKITGYQSHGFWGIINISNRQVTKPEFTALLPGEGLILVAYKRLKGSYKNSAGCINTSGKEIIPFIYDGLKVSSFRVIVVNRLDNQLKHGLLDLSNRKLIPLEYQEIRSIGSLRFAVENFQSKTALYTETGDRITDFSIDSISAFQKNYAVIYQDFRQGLMDRDGRIRIEPKYRNIEFLQDGTIRACLADEWIFLDGQNKFLQTLEADSIDALGNNLFKLQVAGEIQLMDAQFKPISSLSFSYLGKFENGKAIFKRRNKYGLIRQNGEIMIAPIFDSLVTDQNYYIGNLRQQKKNQWTLLDSLGNKKHTKVYDNIEVFDKNLFAVEHHNFWGAINGSGKEIIACVHDSLLQSIGGKVVVKFHGLYGIIDVNENWLVTPQPSRIKLITDDRFLQYTNKTTFLKSIGGSVIYFTENKFEVYQNHLLERLSSGALWAVDLQGRIISRQIQPDEPIEKVFPETEGLRCIKKDGKFGFIDSRGRLRIANRYEGAKSFSENLAAIKILGKWGFINHQDKIAVQPVYDDVTSFQGGASIVTLKNFLGAIDKTGKLILLPRYQKIKILESRRLLITQDGQQGLADANGKILVSPRFDTVHDLDNGYIIVQRNQKYGLLNLQGVSTIPLIYDYISYDRFNNRYMALKKSGWLALQP